MTDPPTDPRELGPQKDERGFFISYGEGAVGWRVPYAPSEVNDEEIYNDDTDCFDMRKVVVECPRCGHMQAALCSPYARLLVAGWRWVGLDHQEPYRTYVTRCRCLELFLFTTYTPQ